MLVTNIFSFSFVVFFNDFFLNGIKSRPFLGEEHQMLKKETEQCAG